MEEDIKILREMLNNTKKNRRGFEEIRFEVDSRCYKAIENILAELEKKNKVIQEIKEYANWHKEHLTEMSKDENKAIEETRKALMETSLGYDVDFDINTLDILLNLIQKQQAEIEKKDKIIDEMAVQIYLTEEQRQEMKEYIWTSNKPKDFKSFVKQYFEKKVEEDNERN